VSLRLFLDRLVKITRNLEQTSLTLILLTWTKWRALTNANKWRIGFNSTFKGLIVCFPFAKPSILTDPLLLLLLVVVVVVVEVVVVGQAVGYKPEDRRFDSC
jgi:hypothetical protein